MTRERIDAGRSPHDDHGRLIAAFHDQFPNCIPSAVVCAPGRVNLIGEHTDYNGYPVLPMALDRATHVAVSTRHDRMICLTNMDAGYGLRMWPLDAGPRPYPQGDWANYVAAALHGLVESGFAMREQMHGLNMLVSGEVPVAAGLSSSSALVVAAAVAGCVANNIPWEPVRLAGELARAERHTGIEGGGMDQAIALLAVEDSALRVSFNPLHAQAAPLPGDAAIIVCNSGVPAEKSAGARDTYNLRVVECRVAAALLARGLEARGLRPQPRADAPRMPLLADLSAFNIGVTDADILNIAQDAIPAGGVQPDEITRLLGWSADEVDERLLTVRGGRVPVPAVGLKPRDRYRHVVDEARRVDDAVKAMRAGDSVLLGALMNDSHASCRDLYEVSCTELDAMVDCARAHGALGARLTGAGFGGCTVNLVPIGGIRRFKEGMLKEYYRTRAPHLADAAALEEAGGVMFATNAGAGVRISDV